ncbi:MAG: DUF1918 domain-containing protein [Acidimicrobiales bacterium]|nr:DUF1918 domain-containing protein [Acidimicrobiales bacterium]MBO0886447.1 DUF1918 domain-containing protein [Acidimicrobiales bacterium]MBO0894359.1 DUF1918 domain-containing protein [Acidimicrobiales bacterium]
MASVGDRVMVESEKVGRESRVGLVVGVDGQMIRVRWDDGNESVLVPSVGSLRVVGHEGEPG